MTVRTNLVTNPSFESGIGGGWVSYSSGGTSTKAQDATTSYDRAASAHVAAASAADGGLQFPLGVLAAGTYAFQVRVKTGANVTNACAVTRRNSDSAVVAGGHVTAANQDWALLSGTFTADGVLSFDIVLGLGSYGAASQGDVWFDACQIEQAASVGTYFDGASTRAGAVDVWTGVADASTSTDTAASGGSVAQYLEALTGFSAESEVQVYAQWAGLTVGPDDSLSRLVNRKLVANGKSAQVRESLEGTLAAGGAVGASVEEMLARTGLTGWS